MCTKRERYSSGAGTRINRELQKREHKTRLKWDASTKHMVERNNAVYIMSADNEDTPASLTSLEDIERLENNIDKEITKLEYYLEPADELIKSNDTAEMELASKIGDKITDLISQLEGTKLDQGILPRTVRQWKKEKKNSFSKYIRLWDACWIGGRIVC